MKTDFQTATETQIYCFNCKIPVDKSHVCMEIKIRKMAEKLGTKLKEKLK